MLKQLYRVFKFYATMNLHNERVFGAIKRVSGQNVKNVKESGLNPAQLDRLPVMIRPDFPPKILVNYNDQLFS